MLRQHENKPIGKSGQRNRKEKSKKTKQPILKPDQQQDPSQLPNVNGVISMPAVSIDLRPADLSVTETASPIGPIAPAEAPPIGFHTIAKAYGDSASKSLEQATSFFERLARERSLVTAFELQIEFAMKAYESFTTDSQKIRELHNELARQRLSHLEGLMEKLTQRAMFRSMHQ